MTFASFPGSGENKPTVVKPEEKGILQKLKEVFWKPSDDEENDQRREKMS